MRKEKNERRKALNIKKIAALIIIVCILGSSIYGIYKGISIYKENQAYKVTILSEDKLNDIDYTTAKKLMIVAHPDDDTLWGGSHLLEGGYLVVCITHGKEDDERAAEFKKAMEYSGNQGLILQYPDKVNGEKADWTRIEKQLKTELKRIIDKSDWELVVTHNEKGEYGHLHHKKTDEVVTEIWREEEKSFELWYFGDYYKKKSLPDVEGELESLDEETIKKKWEMLESYTSQKGTIENLGHMVPYEMWKQCTE